MTWLLFQITLLGNINLDGPRRMDVIMPERFYEMTKTFGAYFQDLTLSIVGFVDRFPPQCKQVIVELAERCRLERLTLDVGVILSKGAFDQNVPRKVELGVLVSLVANAFRLKGLTLKAWPMYRGIQKVDVLEALKSNPKLQGLERLDLFWQSAEGSTWATLNAILPAPTLMLDTVRHFTNLQYLSLRSTMLCQDVIMELAKPGHAPMKKLAILVTYSRYYAQESVPEISSAAWKYLSERSPEMEVEVTVVTRMPFIELAGFLKPEIPLSAIGFMKYSSLRVDDLESIRDKYKRTLRKFVSLVEPDERLDEYLKSLAINSPHLTYLVYHGSLYHRTILELAAIRGTNWYRFNIPEQSIDFSDPSSEDDIGEEVVVVCMPDGSVELADHLRHADHDPEEHREQLVIDLIRAVSKITGCKWRPLDMKVEEERLAEGATSVIQTEGVVRALQQAHAEQD